MGNTAMRPEVVDSKKVWRHAGKGTPAGTLQFKNKSDNYWQQVQAIGAGE